MMRRKPVLHSQLVGMMDPLLEDALYRIGKKNVLKHIKLTMIYT